MQLTSGSRTVNDTPDPRRKPGRPRTDARRVVLQATISVEARRLVEDYRDTHGFAYLSEAVDHLIRTHPLAAVHGLGEPTE